MPAPGGATKLLDLEGGEPAESALFSTGVPELDRVLGGGLVAGSVTLLGGEPGIGKSTLTVQLALEAASEGRKVLIVSAEESKSQVRSRASRLGLIPESLWITQASAFGEALADAISIGPELVIVDSIQTVLDDQTPGAPGSVTQVRQCAQLFTRMAKITGMSVVMVGHVTKDGALAGPRSLEHVVDTVLSFEGDRGGQLRILRALKHRFGGTGEIGLFEMTQLGLQAIDDPSAVLLEDRVPGVAGCVATAITDGNRALVAEVQALVSPSSLPAPRRSAQGLDSSRVAKLVAVIEKRCGIPLGGMDIFVSVAGGIKLVEPGSDLAVALAIVSSATGIAIDDNVAVFGEIGLAGEVRTVPNARARTEEALRHGFRRVILPPRVETDRNGKELIRASTLVNAIEYLELCGSSTPN